MACCSEEGAGRDESLVSGTVTTGSLLPLYATALAGLEA